jgi:hypothetical protein
MSFSVHYGLVGYDTMWSGRWLSVLQRNILLCLQCIFLQNGGTHFPEDNSLNLYHSEDLKSCSYSAGL